MEVFIMARGKSGKPVRSDRLLMILCNGGKVSLKEIADTMEYGNMYRISCILYEIKLNGGVIKVYKNGRKVEAYELVNAQELIDKILTPKGLSVVPIVGRDSNIGSLSDLKAKSETKKVKAQAESLEIEEITE
jgi:hypothetical protein